ncbi:hypothetical protein V6N11_049837 [Hibiscus sabdariffa]|uniref:Retroviral polymerase SH3-like domain-containing protein n=1 Tax=Hibiscus sabdariffa TaxID=183260 RepID=A0ABR2T8I9_9ROSI
MTQKLEPRSVECVFLGYYVTQSAYKFLESTTNRIYVSHHVPHIFPFATRHGLPMPQQPDVSLPIMSRQLATSLPTMPRQPDASLPIVPDDSIATPVPLVDLPQPHQDVSPDLPQHHPLQQ